ncbi:SE1832 family protein [Gracilibacillus xinjiangensis]|uniref:SE1832 family protein n=1 Tax=Gracilibacillus xinjiangensis TaxID=1193282 RepID=A0ABV8WV06_9BACI
MNRKEIEDKIEELKSDHTRLSADMEKLVYVKGKTEITDKELERIEKEIAELRKKLQTM